jgi:hypothetical protein
MEQKNKTFAEIIEEIRERANQNKRSQTKSPEEIRKILEARFKKIKELSKKNGDNL